MTDIKEATKPKPPDRENPEPNVFLRNRLRVRRGGARQFLRGKEEFLKKTKNELWHNDGDRLQPKSAWKLIAACGEQPMSLDKPLPEEEQEVLQIWELGAWDTLYKSIFIFSEQEWYRTLGKSLADEDQQLLIGITSGDTIAPRGNWRGDDDPAYVYLYEEATLPLGAAHGYLRELNWFASQVTKEWKRIWAAGQITGRPATICSLWQVPSPRENVDKTLRDIASNVATCKRYADFVALPSKLVSKIYYPIYTERLDEEDLRENSHLVEMPDDAKPK
jgi:hypothetical protein